MEKIFIYSKDSQLTKGEIEDILKQSIQNLILEIKSVIEKNYRAIELKTLYNNHIKNWNEVLCSIEGKGKEINVKLINDNRCDDSNNISSIYVKVFSDRKGIFTDCIERINQNYEFISSTYDYLPLNESELSFKQVDANRIIDCIISELNKII